MGAKFTVEVTDLSCAVCGDSIERGYAPAERTDTGHVLREEAAVCDVCGFSEVGFMGCAPELGDFETGGDVLVSFSFDNGVTDVRITDEG